MRKNGLLIIISVSNLKLFFIPSSFFNYFRLELKNSILEKIGRRQRERERKERKLRDMESKERGRVTLIILMRE